MQWHRHIAAAAALGAVGLLAVSAGADEAPRFDLPVACPADAGCLVRNFVDEDPGADVKDWRCGRLTYDGHKGTDIRVPDGVAMAKGVQVLAAAPGTVLRLRDGMDDVSIRVTGADAVKDREAGNSLIIDHGGGWETQYGHLRKGSIIVKPGQTVAAEQPIALMGLSGNTEFTHTHFEVRHNGKPVDPYNGADMGTGCSGGTPMWTPRALAALAYREDAPFDAGFADARPDEWAARAGTYAGLGLTVDSPALVFWIDVLGHRAGDRQSLRLLGPDGAMLAEAAADIVKEAHIQWFQFVGKKRPPNGWPAGRYRGEYSLTRDVNGQPQTVIAIKREIELR